jgi:1,4-dihydroxy-2-naphthoate octaprenyltransferase
MLLSLNQKKFGYFPFGEMTSNVFNGKLMISTVISQCVVLGLAID